MPFKDDFRELTGFPPFPWQARLFERLAADEIPDACDIPTGLGKTSVMAIWLAALDLRQGSRTSLPRRLIYVVDRRAVVDQATEEAKKLADALGDGAQASSVVHHLRQRLRLDDGDELAVSTLRGQLADKGRWLEDPAAPAIVVGTVDMIGSRLLFSGYNTSRRMRPVHAALLGSDALIVLDEAHLVPPFQALVAQVRRFAEEDRGRSSLPARPMHLLTLSATGRGSGGKMFDLGTDNKDDEHGDIVRERLQAPKWLRIEPEVAAGDLADALAARAWERGEGGRRVIVFCNSRKTAEDIHKALEGKLTAALKARDGKKPASLTDNIELIVGSRRVRERELLAKSGAFKRFSPKHAKETAESDMPAFLVATSAGEVGVDLDADHMVCDLVAWERMVQRLGRVNRLGKFTAGSLIDVFPSPSAGSDKAAEANIKADTIETWRAPFDRGPWETRDDDRRNASPGALKALRDDADFAEAARHATTPAPLRPALRRADIDAWAMTSLDAHTGRAAVAPWLRGWETDDKPQTQLLWRASLPIRDTDDVEDTRRQLNDYFDHARPHLGEILETETWLAADLIQKRAKAVLKRLAKVEHDERTGAPGGTDDDEASAQPALTPNAIVAITLGHDRTVGHAWHLRTLDDMAKRDLERDIAGRMIVLSAALGGLSASGMPDPKADAPPSTIDEKHHPETIEEELGGQSLWSQKRLQQIGFRVQCVKPSDAEHDAKKKGEKNWRIAYRRVVSARDDEAGAANAPEWRVERWFGGRAADNSGGLAKADQSIADHHRDAAAKADDICRRLGLPETLHNVIVMAAANHDWGKARRNWQRFAGNPSWTGDPEDALAKFKTGGSASALKMGDKTYRHEFGSLVDVIDKKTLDGLDDELRDLALHLIAAHHGHARPAIAPLDEKHMPENNAPLARDAALRFARLQARWGPWGLAWLEALVRAADASASRAHNEAAQDASESEASSQAEASDAPAEKAA